MADWYASVKRQTDQNFQLWIALDGLDVDSVYKAMKGRPGAEWIHAEAGDSPATIRQRLLAPVVKQFNSAVLVDSDDILHPERVAAARQGLRQHELVACALRLVDHQGTDLGITFDMPQQAELDTVLPRNNIFGLSNTAWRCDLLQLCLPIPSDVELVDWFLATRAWLLGAELAFDSAIGMDYRQHIANMARVCAPFDRKQVLRDTERVNHHFRIMQRTLPSDAISSRLAQLERVAEDVKQFSRWLVEKPERIDRYLVDLNALNPAPLWWSCVAQPLLKHLWSS